MVCDDLSLFGRRHVHLRPQSLEQRSSVSIVSHLPENTVDREPRGLMIGGQTQDRAYQLAQAVVNGAQEFIHNASRGGGRMDELVHHHAEKQVGLILVL